MVVDGDTFLRNQITVSTTTMSSNDDDAHDLQIGTQPLASFLRSLLDAKIDGSVPIEHGCFPSQDEAEGDHTNRAQVNLVSDPARSIGLFHCSCDESSDGSMSASLEAMQLQERSRNAPLLPIRTESPHFVRRKHATHMAFSSSSNGNDDDDDTYDDDDARELERLEKRMRRKQRRRQRRRGRCIERGQDNRTTNNHCNRECNDNGDGDAGSGVDYRYHHWSAQARRSTAIDQRMNEQRWKGSDRSPSNNSKSNNSAKGDKNPAHSPRSPMPVPPPFLEALSLSSSSLSMEIVGNEASLEHGGDCIPRSHSVPSLSDMIRRHPSAHRRSTTSSVTSSSTQGTKRCRWTQL